MYSIVYRNGLKEMLAAWYSRMWLLGFRYQNFLWIYRLLTCSGQRTHGFLKQKTTCLATVLRTM